MSGVRCQVSEKKLKAKNDKSSGQWAVSSGPLAVGINKWKVERKNK